MHKKRLLTSGAMIAPAPLKLWPRYWPLLACALVATYPLFRAGFFLGDDLSWGVVRLAEYAHALRTGDFPVRWGANLEGGYGYPIYNFYSPLFMLIASFFVIAGGLTILASIKLALALLTLAAGIGMYWFAREHFGHQGGMLAGCLYLLAPYHFFDAFVRSAFAEFTALAIVPFIFFAMARTLKETSVRRSTLFMLIASGTLLVLSHNLSFLMYAPLILLYFIVGAAFSRQWGKLRVAAIALLLVFALSSFYTLPLVMEKQYVQLWMLTAGKFSVLENFLPLGKLIGAWLNPIYGLLIPISLAITMVYRNRIGQPDFAILCGLVIALLVLLFLNTSASRTVWSAASFLGWLQFPWRLLSPITFVICFLSGSIAYLNAGRIRTIAIAGIIFLGVVAAMALTGVLVLRGIFVPVHDEEFTPERIRTQWLSTTVLSEYLPVWVTDKPALPAKDRISAPPSGVTIKEISAAQNCYLYKMNAVNDTMLTANLFFFPGWKIHINGQEAPLQISAQGLMRFRVPGGQSLVEVRLEATSVRMFGNSLSVSGLLLFGLMLLPPIWPRRMAWLRGANDA